MRVLYLSHRYQDTKTGGLAEFLHYLPLALQSWGVIPFLYTQSAHHSLTTLQEPELLPNRMLHYSGPFLKPSILPSKKALHCVIRLCRAQNIELIHAQGTYRAGYLAMRVARKIDIPYLVTSHSDILPTNSKRIKRYSTRTRCQKVLKQATHVTHLTPFMAKTSHSLHDTQHKSTIIGNGIDYAAWQPYIHTEEQDYMLAIGRLEPEKGFNVLIESFAQLNKLGCTSSLVIAGTGSMDQALRNQVHALGLTLVDQWNPSSMLPARSVVFTNYVRHDIKIRLFAAAKCILFAPQPHIWEEPFGIVQLEAMAAGKILIASSTAATRCLQSQGVKNILVEANNRLAWKNAMQQVLENENDRKINGKINREKSKFYDWKHIAQNYMRVYEQIVKSTSRNEAFLSQKCMQ